MKKFFNRIKRYFGAKDPNSFSKYPGYLYFRKKMFDLSESERSCAEIKNKKIIWQMWWQPDDPPPLVKICLERNKRFLPNDYEYVLITQNNVDDWIYIPEFVKNKVKAGVISITHLSDYVRLSLLSQYGGVWIDATCLLTAPIPSEILNSDLFYFQTPSWYMSKSVPSEKLLEVYLSSPFFNGNLISGSSWFLVAKADSCLLKTVKLLLEKYWSSENELTDYFLFHCATTYAILHRKECNEEFSLMLKRSNIPPHVLQFSLFKSFDLWEEVTSQCFIHKLTYKFKKSKLDNLQSGTILERMLKNDF